MSSSRRRKKPGLTIVAAFLLVLVALIISSGQSSAGDGLKVVRGWVWDIAGRNITDASVVVTIWEDETKTTQRKSLSEPTDEEGFYSLQFAPEEWYVGDYIEVICTYNGKQETNYTTAVSSAGSPIQYVNITYPYEIPEFGGEMGFIVAGGAIGAVALITIFATQKRRAKS